MWNVLRRARKRPCKLCAWVARANPAHWIHGRNGAIFECSIEFYLCVYNKMDILCKISEQWLCSCKFVTVYYLLIWLAYSSWSSFFVWRKYQVIDDYNWLILIFWLDLNLGPCYVLGRLNKRIFRGLIEMGRHLFERKIGTFWII